jgi:hypothetical protein
MCSIRQANLYTLYTYECMHYRTRHNAQCTFSDFTKFVLCDLTSMRNKSDEINAYAQYIHAHKRCTHYIHAHKRCASGRANEARLGHQSLLRDPVCCVRWDWKQRSTAWHRFPTCTHNVKITKRPDVFQLSGHACTNFCSIYVGKCSRLVKVAFTCQCL